jgi:predicted O-methyltransferase YrrM
MIPLFETDGTSTCPLGLPMCQNRLAVPTWSYAMEKLPPRQIVEIGSYNGGLATALGLHARVIGAQLFTYDINAQSEAIVPIGKLLGVNFRVADVWEREAEIADIIRRPGSSFVLCDGGNKPRELATFVRYLKPGDVIAAHDYDAMHEANATTPQLERYWPFSEITRAVAEKAIAPYPDLAPWMQEHFDCAGWIVYRRRP